MIINLAGIFTKRFTCKKQSITPDHVKFILWKDIIVHEMLALLFHWICSISEFKNGHVRQIPLSIKL